jgi:hypothetical protein
VPIRTASGEDVRVLLGSLDGLMSALTLAGQKDARLAELMREQLKEAREAVARFAPSGKRTNGRDAGTLPIV